VRRLAAYAIAGAALTFGVCGAWSWAIGTVALAVLAFMVARDAAKATLREGNDNAKN
jgi:hypothetical protein